LGRNLDTLNSRPSYRLVKYSGRFGFG